MVGSGGMDGIWASGKWSRRMRKADRLRIFGVTSDRAASVMLDGVRRGVNRARAGRIRGLQGTESPQPLGVEGHCLPHLGWAIASTPGSSGTERRRGPLARSTGVGQPRIHDKGLSDRSCLTTSHQPIPLPSPPGTDWAVGNVALAGSGFDPLVGDTLMIGGLNSWLDTLRKKHVLLSA